MPVFSRWPSGALAWAALLLAACNPTLNWRELRPEGAPLLALMPCKPENATRPVPMLGQPTALHMHSCEAGGLTFAVAWAELANPERASEAIDQWQTASLAAIRVVPGSSTAWEAKLAGASALRGVIAEGSDHQGRALQTQVQYFAQGNKLYQAAIYGTRIDKEARTVFFDGLSLQ